MPGDQVALTCNDDSKAAIGRPVDRIEYDVLPEFKILDISRARIPYRQRIAAVAGDDGATIQGCVSKVVEILWRRPPSGLICA